MSMVIAVAGLLLTALAASAQTYVVVDESPSDSPITLKGTVTIDPTNPPNSVCSFIVHNSSLKTAVAWRLEIDIDTPKSYGQHVSLGHDHFFHDQNTLLALSAPPNADYTPNAIDFDCSIVTGGFRSRTVWVQFIDGSTWGDLAVQADMMKQRINALDLLNALESAYSSGGETGFRDALASYQLAGKPEQETMLRAEAFNAKSELLLLRGVSAHLAEVNRRLSVVSARSAWLK